MGTVVDIIPRPPFLPAGYRCWGQHGHDMSCYCGNAKSKWLRRNASHAAGKHVRPQVDCWVCWELGRFPKDQDTEAPPHDHLPTELCATDCDRYWYDQR